MKQMNAVQIGPGPLQSSANVHYPTIVGGIPGVGTSASHNEGSTPVTQQPPTPA